MKKNTKIVLIILLLAVLGAVLVLNMKKSSNFGNNDSTQNSISLLPDSFAEELKDIALPKGFKIKTFASNLKTAPRLMLVVDDAVFVSLRDSGKVVALIDKNNDGTADKEFTFIDGLTKPHGLEYYNGWYYIAEENKVFRVKDTNNDFSADLSTRENLVELPSGGNHFTRTIKIHDNSLYISAGSTCNVCYESDEKRAAIQKCELDGKNCRIYARGLRNSVGMAFDSSGKLFATENGRDNIGDDIPPDEINLIQDGKDYGWPVCYGKNIHDTNFDKSSSNPCVNKEASFIDLQAHSAPLGLGFYYGNKFPNKYRGRLFVAFHGSWNRQVPTGYKVVSIDMDTLKIEDFATGWLQDSRVSGRPVDVVEYKNSLLVSDDYSGKIYMIYYSG